MTGKIYTAVIGGGTELWANGLERKLVALVYYKPYFDGATIKGFSPRLEIEH